MSESIVSPDDAMAPAERLWSVLGSVCTMLMARQGGAMAVQEVPGGRFVHVGTGLLDSWARPAAEVLGRAPGEIFEAASAASLRVAEQATLGHPGPLTSEHRLEGGGQRRDWVVQRVLSPADADGRRWLVSLWTDPAPERQREAQLRQALAQIETEQRHNEALRRELADQALRDAASGLYSRAHFEDQLRREVDLSTREHREFAIVYIQLDPPSEQVRALGAAGEQSIHAAMGRLLRSGTRAMDASCRLDDRRFAVLLSGVGLATAHARAEGLRRRCATEIVVHDGQELGFSVAMGVASFPHTAQSQGDLIAACEAALAEARRRGGNLVTLAAIRFEAG
jgi:diguanylate cyclase (GGDEF)-like protein